jgi:dephospho-CoA kinase
MLVADKTFTDQETAYGEQGQKYQSYQGYRSNPAYQSTATSTLPTLVFMAGFAGAGKTTLVQYLQEKLGWEMLNKDQLKRQYLAEGKIGDGEKWENFVEAAGRKAFDTLFDLTEKLFGNEHKSLIVDTCGFPPFIFTKMLQIQQRSQKRCEIKVLLCSATKETRTNRLLQRGSEFASCVYELQGKLHEMQAEACFTHLCKLPEIPDDAEEQEHFKRLFDYSLTRVLNTNGSLDTYKDEALRYLQPKNYQIVSLDNVLYYN